MGFGNLARGVDATLQVTSLASRLFTSLGGKSGVASNSSAQSAVINSGKVSGCCGVISTHSIYVSTCAM